MTVLRRTAALMAAVVLALVATVALLAGPAAAQTAPVIEPPAVPTEADTAAAAQTNPDDPAATGQATIDVSFPDVAGEPSNTVVIILALTLLSVAPSLLIMCTSFTRIVIVLSLTRNALGINEIPPRQVITGLSLFLTLFVMAPVLKDINEEALQPYLNGEMSLSEAAHTAEGPLRGFLLEHTREGELKLFLDANETPEVTRDEVPLTALVPAFVLSELKTAFIIGFAVFVPFLVIDLVVSAVLMSLGMMMLPPTFVSLPFKILLFVMLDGWTLVVTTLLTSYQ
jgi:flagellar biosynthesis protein FliP